MVLAWGLVPTESEATWAYFMSHLQAAIPEVDTNTTTVMSDRDKGFAAAGASTLPNVSRVFCTQHISENVRRHFGVGARGSFKQVAGTMTKDSFHRAMEGLKMISPAAHEYVEGIPLDT